MDLLASCNDLGRGHLRPHLQCSLLAFGMLVSAFPSPCVQALRAALQGDHQACGWHSACSEEMYIGPLILSSFWEDRSSVIGHEEVLGEDWECRRSWESAEAQGLGEPGSAKCAMKPVAGEEGGCASSGPGGEAPSLLSAQGAPGSGPCLCPSLAPERPCASLPTPLSTRE